MGEVVVISREQALERLAEIDAILDIMETYNESELRVEREQITWLLGDD
jgi:hypothetical protein